MLEMTKIDDDCCANAIGMLERFPSLGFIGIAEYFMCDGKLWCIYRLLTTDNEVYRCDDQYLQQRILKELNARRTDKGSDQPTSIMIYADGSPVQRGLTVIADHYEQEFHIKIRSMSKVSHSILLSLIQNLFEVIDLKAGNETIVVHETKRRDL